MICPKCKTGSLATLETREVPEPHWLVRRRRQCSNAKCAFTFHTYEIMVQYFERLSATEKFLITMRELFTGVKPSEAHQPRRPGRKP